MIMSYCETLFTHVLIQIIARHYGLLGEEMEIAGRKIFLEEKGKNHIFVKALW